MNIEQRARALRAQIKLAATTAALGQALIKNDDNTAYNLVREARATVKVLRKAVVVGVEMHHDAIEDTETIDLSDATVASGKPVIACGHHRAFHQPPAGKGYGSCSQCMCNGAHLNGAPALHEDYPASDIARCGCPRGGPHVG